MGVVWRALKVSLRWEGRAESSAAMSMMDEFKSKVKGRGFRVVLPEGHDAFEEPHFDVHLYFISPGERQVELVPHEH